MAKVQEIGPYSAYAIAVKYGYKGTEEEWVKEQEADRKAAEAAAAAAAQSAKDAAASASGVAQSGQQAVQSIKDAQTAAEQAIETAKQDAVQAAQAEAEKASASAGQAASSAAEAAQSATNAAAEVGKVQSAGTSAVQAVRAAQSTATEAVSAAQQTATQTVSEAQATAVSAVQEAGTTQTSAIESAGTAAVADVSNAKTEALSQISAAGTAQVSAVGTAGADAVEDVNDAKTAALEAIDAANAALPSPTQSDAGRVPTVKADGSAYELAGPYAPLSAAIRPTASGNPVSITDSVEWPLQGLKVYGKSTQDGTPSPENPVPIVSAGASGSIETTITGKNLLTGRLYFGDYINASARIRNENAVSLPYTPDRETKGVCYTVPVKKGVTYTFSVTNPNTNARLFLALYRTFEDAFNTDNVLSQTNAPSSISITASEDGILVCLIAGTWTDGSTTIHECTASELLQLEIGSTATTYEAPHSQSLTISTPNGLPGIPVNSGGNYTDAEGQQWVCDEIDYARKVYVQKITQIMFDGSSDELWKIATNATTQRNFFQILLEEAALRNNRNDNVLLCQAFTYMSYGYDTPSGDNTVCFQSNDLSFACSTSLFNSVDDWKQYLTENPMTLIYAIANPIETPLSEEEIAAYRTLHTYDGATVVSTAEDVAGLEVKYLADGEKYVERIVSQKASEAAAAHTMALLADGIREGVNES